MLAVKLNLSHYVNDVDWGCCRQHTEKHIGPNGRKSQQAGENCRMQIFTFLTHCYCNQVKECETDRQTEMTLARMESENNVCLRGKDRLECVFIDGRKTLNGI